MSPVEGTRLRILHLLQRWGEATVGRLARELGLAPTSVRRHLDVLQRDHLASFREVRKRTGRPEHTYFLTEAGQEVLPKGYQSLLDRLMHHLLQLRGDDLQGLEGPALVSLLLDRIAGELAVGASTRNGHDPEERLDALHTLLAREQFAPEVVRQGETVRVLLHNCPFRAVARHQHLMCRLDERLIGLMLQANVQRERCVLADDHVCCYSASLLPPQGEGSEARPTQSLTPSPEGVSPLPR